MVSAGVCSTIDLFTPLLVGMRTTPLRAARVPHACSRAAESTQHILMFRQCVRRFHLVLNTHLIMPAVSVTPIPLFEDNYCWRIDNTVHRTSIVVDPAEAHKVLATYGADAPELVAALTTHHHPDHSGGNEDLVKARADVAVIAGTEEGDRVPAATRFVADGERFEVGGVTFTALHTPCHTKGHICYYVEASGEQPPLVFTGDTLFSAGCGRFFEGDASQMLASLAKLAALPDATQVYCGHEYTASNLRFGLHVEPGNAAMKSRAAEVEALRAAGKPSVPVSIATEKATNVFMRTGEPSVIAFTHPDWRAEGEGGAAPAKPDAAEVMARLREAKNAFRG